MIFQILVVLWGNEWCLIHLGLIFGDFLAYIDVHKIPPISCILSSGFIADKVQPAIFLQMVNLPILICTLHWMLKFFFDSKLVVEMKGIHSSSGDPTDCINFVFVQEATFLWTKLKFVILFCKDLQAWVLSEIGMQQL